MPFTQEQNDTLQLAIRITSSLSIVGTIAIISSYCAYSRFRTQMNTMVVFISVADLMSSLNTFLGDWPGKLITSNPNSSLLCTVQGLNIELWFLSGAFWTGAMATHCLLAVTLSKPIAQLEPYYKYYHLISWGLPTLIACASFLLQPILEQGPVYVPIGLWCWVSSNYSIYRIILFYGPVWLVFLYNAICYSVIGWKLRRLSKLLSNSRYKKTGKHTSRFVVKTLVYMLAFVINWSCSTANRVQGILNPENPVFGLHLAQAITLPLQGFLNSLIYFAFAMFLDRTKNSDSSSSKIDSSMVTGGSQFSNQSDAPLWKGDTSMGFRM